MEVFRIKNDVMTCLINERPVGPDNNTDILIYSEIALMEMVMT